MIDITTKNKSFKNMRNELYDAGIFNCDFLLKLNDRDLMHIPENPAEWDKTLREKIAKECKDNFWFFVREIIRIPSELNIRYKDPYEYCTRFTLRLNTLRLFYAYTENADIIYKTNNDQSINEAIAILLIYDFIIKGSLYPNYDNFVPKEIEDIINRISELNKYSIFMYDFDYDSIIRSNSNDEAVLVKYIFDILHIGRVAFSHNIKLINKNNTIKSLDELYKYDFEPEDIEAVLVRDALLPYLYNSITPELDGTNIFNETSKLKNSTVYVEGESKH